MASRWGSGMSFWLPAAKRRGAGGARKDAHRKLRTRLPRDEETTMAVTRRKKKKAAKSKKKTSGKKKGRKKASKAGKKTTKRKAKGKKATKRKGEAKTAKKAKRTKKGKKRKPNPAFMKALQPSAELAVVVGSTPLPRTQVIKKLWIYIKKHDLQDAKNRRMVNSDAALKPVFGGKRQVSMFQMMGLINKHLK